MREVNIILDRKEIAIAFSEIGISEVQKLSKKLLVGRKTKTYRENEKYIEMQIEKLKLR